MSQVRCLKDICLTHDKARISTSQMCPHLINSCVPPPMGAVGVTLKDRETLSQDFLKIALGYVWMSLTPKLQF